MSHQVYLGSRNSILKICATHANGRIEQTTGTLIKDAETVLTCAHGLIGAVKAEAYLDSRIRWPVIHVVTIPAIDVAILKLGTPNTQVTAATPISINLTQNLEVGNRVYLFGYPGEVEEITMVPVTVSAETKIPRFGHNIPHVRLNGDIIGGYSGGPLIRMFEGRPQLLGIVTDKECTIREAIDKLTATHPEYAALADIIKKGHNSGIGYAILVKEIIARSPEVKEIFQNQIL